MENGEKKTDNIKDIGVQKEAVDKLIESSTLNMDFYFMMVLSSAIVCLGILLNNIVIVIGGMVVTPFLSPLLMLSLAFVISDIDIIKRSFFIILKSVAVIVATSLVVTILVPSSDVDLSLISGIGHINLSYFYVSLVVGIAGAYSWARPNLSSVLPGVAISVALLPPLVSFAVSLAFFDADLIAGTIRSAAANMTGVILASTFVFAILGFYRVRGYVRKEIGQKKETVLE
ncbi:DUF389 domain-containing protein [Patescibacteria group bacterium]|nr:DUF389 domain-containing protein [Patescibacteria group bacterium]